jgi:hypothetical protein
MSETDTGAALPGTGRPVTDRAWVRWAVAGAVTGMLSWVAGVALISLDAKLDKGNQHLAQVLRAHVVQGYAAALLAVLGAVLLAGFFAVLTRLVPPGHPGWGLLRVSLAGCVITQTLVAIGASFALAGVHAAAGTADAGLIAFGWRGLWLTFTASAVPTMWTSATAARSPAAVAAGTSINCCCGTAIPAGPNWYRPPPCSS